MVPCRCGRSSLSPARATRGDRARRGVVAAITRRNGLFVVVVVVVVSLLESTRRHKRGDRTSWSLVANYLDGRRRVNPTE